MIKVFISQPMKDKTEEQILAEREKAIATIKEQHGECEILDTYFADFNDSNIKNKPLAYLSKSLSFLSKADVAYFCKDWDKYRGCKIEHTCATEYGIEVIEA